MVFALHANVKHSVFCFRKLLQMNTSKEITPGSLGATLAPISFNFFYFDLADILYF